MFVYDNISNLKSNIDAELFILDNQINSTSQREDEVYKGFINLPINEEVNLTNALILNDFNEAFASTSQMLEELKEQKERLETIKNFVSKIDDSQDLNESSFKGELHNMLADYYSFRNDVQAKYISEDKNLDELKQKVNKFIPIETEQPAEVVEPLQPEEIAEQTAEVANPEAEPLQPEEIAEQTVEVAEPDAENSEVEADKPKEFADATLETPKKKHPDPFTEDTFNQNLGSQDFDELDNLEAQDIDDFDESNDSETQNVEDLDDIETQNDKEDVFEDNIFKQATGSKNKKEAENLAPAGIPLQDNRLLFISETQNKVYLPYYITDLQQILLKSDYEDYDELIENDYVVPLNRYKNPRISRFKEGFNLMRRKEYESIGSSLSYGLKLMNNDRLHPAIISACRNSQELNTYLDCLEEDRLNSFKIFEIQFDVPPSKT